MLKTGAPLEGKNRSLFRFIAVTAAVFIFLALAVTIFYKFYQKCDCLHFTYLKKGVRHAPIHIDESDPLEDKPDDEPAY